MLFLSSANYVSCKFLGERVGAVQGAAKRFVKQATWVEMLMSRFIYLSAEMAGYDGWQLAP